MAVELKVVCDGPFGDTGQLNAVSCREDRWRWVEFLKKRVMAHPTTEWKTRHHPGM